MGWRLDRPARIIVTSVAVVFVTLFSAMHLTSAGSVEPTAAWEAIMRTDDHDGANRPRTTPPGPLFFEQLPTDPFRRCATKALRGDFGTLKTWQLAAYEWGLAQGITVPAGNRSKITSYGKWEPCGDYTASGDRFSLEFVSVPPKHIALGWIVWTPWGLRYAMDTGGAVKARKPYIIVGENMNLDYATAKGKATKRKKPWVVIKKKTSWNWYGERKWGDYSKKGQR